MRNSRFNSLPQLAAVMTGFAVTILLLESQGLVTWADRLDVGPVRTGALEVTTALHKSLRPLGIEEARKESLEGLARLGWTDDPAQLLAAREELEGGVNGPACVASRPALEASAPKAASSAEASIPIVASVPRLTPLVPLPPITPGKPRVVALVGDSMMGSSLSFVILRQTAHDPDLHVIEAIKAGTGLARPDVFDWMQEYPAMIGAEKPDAVIVAIGTNDGQNFVDNGKGLAFGSEGWVKAYRQRTADFLNLLTQDGARVVWIGLPPMKSGSLNERAEEINRIAYSVVSRNPQAVWWNPEQYVGDDTGGFREFMTGADGRTTRIRTADGIHLSDEGSALLTPSLLEWLNSMPPATTARNTPQGLQQNFPNRRRGKNGRVARP